MDKTKPSDVTQNIKWIFRSLVILGILMTPPAIILADTDDKKGKYEAEALVMSVNLEQSYLIVAEKVIVVVQNANIGYSPTDLRGINGNPVKLSSFSEGQNVHVKGLIGGNGEIVATSIQMLKIVLDL